ncbi:hypothetical protein EDI_039500 [Entamoeba dispar SAW760]|uniref:Uncharacterized protein n=1 Tax=Entamoeba dispar (strain ATCC PRA-260 / SAW760) TaxID=370354 RepID=B0ESN5_ENTDS|nr:uncharacterized protein EDI_039500 [Entamoeba dispar SAW760]EDR22462.1 hypothetical protein EDI_039500 [Entamoeba dispar SAW760]|eukprot:EDR22462.1 hypothetical protein EDI_039500 [Entamoeba dispar SAW760]
MASQILPPLISASGKIIVTLIAGGFGTKAVELFTSYKKADSSKSVEELKQEYEELKNKNKELENKLKTKEWEHFLSLLKGKDDIIKLAEFYKKQHQEFEEQMNTRLLEKDNQIISLQNQINQLKDKSATKPSNWEVYFKWGLIIVNVIILVVGVLLHLTK